MLGQVRLYGQRFIQYASPYDLQEVGIFFPTRIPGRKSRTRRSRLEHDRKQYFRRFEIILVGNFSKLFCLFIY